MSSNPMRSRDLAPENHTILCKNAEISQAVTLNLGQELKRNNIGCMISHRIDILIIVTL